MKIISYGYVQPKKKSCAECGATYEYLPRDIETFRPGTRNAKNFVRCPVCGNIAFVDDMLIKHDKYLVFANEGK